MKTMKVVVVTVVALGVALVALVSQFESQTSNAEPIQVQRSESDRETTPPEDFSQPLKLDTERVPVNEIESVGQLKIHGISPTPEARDPFEEEMLDKYSNLNLVQLSEVHKRLRVEIGKEKLDELGKRHDSGLYEDELPMNDPRPMDWSSNPPGILASGTIFVELPSGPVNRLTRLPASEYPALANKLRELEWLGDRLGIGTESE